MSSSRSRAIARAAPAITRRNSSRGAGFVMPGSSNLACDAFGKVGPEHPLVIFRDQRPFRFVALVDERDPKGVADIAEDERVLRPADYRARAHHRRDVAVDET